VRRRVRHIRIIILLDILENKIREAMLASFGDEGGWFIVDIINKDSRKLL
jgi:hypothetical protein